MQLDPTGRGKPEVYKLITAIVVPRPIAWVMTKGRSGLTNLAPFSAFTFLASDPPMLLFCVARRGEGDKDTVRNILETGTFVVHIADRPLLDPLHRSAFEYPEHVSEVAELGLKTAPGVRIDVPHLTSAPVAMECRLTESREYGREAVRMVVGEVEMFHIRDGLLTDGKIDSRALDPVCRLAGPNYATLGEILHLDRVDTMTGT